LPQNSHKITDQSLSYNENIKTVPETINESSKEISNKNNVQTSSEEEGDKKLSQALREASPIIEELMKWESDLKFSDSEREYRQRQIAYKFMENKKDLIAEVDKARSVRQKFAHKNIVAIPMIGPSTVEIRMSRNLATEMMYKYAERNDTQEKGKMLSWELSIGEEVKEYMGKDWLTFFTYDYNN
jgi:hypothetical protein